MPYLLDENLSPRIARLARDLGVDIVSTHERGRTGASDSSQLEYAAAEGRCLVTLDEVDLRDWTNRFFAEGKVHAGVLIITWRVYRRNFPTVARLLSQFDEAHPHGLQPYSFMYLPHPADA
ncbi:MAG: DUF5615 family PIN-like protein [Dehalococcoidia bacterium]